jgi:acyl-CoA thioesterase I
MRAFEGILLGSFVISEEHAQLSKTGNAVVRLNKHGFISVFLGVIERKRTMVSKGIPSIENPVLRLPVWFVTLVLIGLVQGCGVGVVHAITVRIVALGGSNTWGKLVSRSQAYPAHLERMLRKRGITARVHNAGVNGSTTAEMLARLPSVVPRGTRLVIFHPGGNDRRYGVPRSVRRHNIRAVKRWLRTRGIAVVMLRGDIIWPLKDRYYLPDGKHFTGAGYRAMAARLLPRVLAALGRR